MWEGPMAKSSKNCRQKALSPKGLLIYTKRISRRWGHWNVFAVESTTALFRQETSQLVVALTLPSYKVPNVTIIAPLSMLGEIHKSTGKPCYHWENTTVGTYTSGKAVPAHFTHWWNAHARNALLMLRDSLKNCSVPGSLTILPMFWNANFMHWHMKLSAMKDPKMLNRWLTLKWGRATPTCQNPHSASWLNLGLKTSTYTGNTTKLQPTLD